MVFSYDSRKIYTYDIYADGVYSRVIDHYYDVIDKRFKYGNGNSNKKAIRLFQKLDEWYDQEEIMRFEFAYQKSKFRKE